MQNTFSNCMSDPTYQTFIVTLFIKIHAPITLEGSPGQTMKNDQLQRLH